MSPRGVYERKPKVESTNEIPPIDVKPVIQSGLVCKNCQHDVKMHYGSKYDQCNTRDCPCLVLKK